MSCCGNKRNAFREQNNTEVSRKTASRAIHSQTRSTHEKPVVMQYTGNSSLEVRGSFSRRLYRFTQSGAMLEVDIRDSPGLLALGQLKRK